MTEQQLQDAFHVYTSSLTAVRASKCYWSVLHVVLSLPDICAALQNANGETTGAKYAAWCDQFVPDSRLTGADWYKMRCAVLHLGSSIPQQRPPLSQLRQLLVY
jgi:hypothetical protein